ncbi:maestro heat-like repeat-containing protein family member 1 isoform X2 [Tachyglossus aculeatus]|nr:maestro heat-like repeat-containing protein family member 1 isoform X2 [Tachyglossus aculeatus]
MEKEADTGTPVEDPVTEFSALYSQISNCSGEFSVVKREAALLQLLDLASEHLEKLLAFLFQKIEEEEGNEAMVSGTVGILELLVKSEENFMTPYIMVDFQQALCPLLQNPSYLVKETVTKLINTMGKCGHLTLECSTVFVRFLLDQCVLTCDHPSPDGKKIEDQEKKLKDLCRQSLSDCIVNPSMTKVLWPLLLEYIIPGQYVSSIPFLLKCVLLMATKLLREERAALSIVYPEYNNQGILPTYTAKQRIPRPPTLFLRLLVLSSSASVLNQEHAKALRILALLRPSISKQLGKSWVSRIICLLNYLEGDKNNFSQKLWDEKLLLFLESTLRGIAAQNWTASFLEAITLQLPFSHQQSHEKSFLYRSWGTAQKVSEEPQSEEQLWACLESINCQEAMECEGFACGVGFWASANLHEVLHELKRMTILTKKVHDGQELYYLKLPSCKEMVQLLMLCYQCVTLLTPNEELLPIMESAVIEEIVDCYGYGPRISSNPEIQREFVQSLLITGKFMAREKVTFPNVQLRERSMMYLLDILMIESNKDLSSQILPDIMIALSYLGELDPPLTEEMYDLLIICCLRRIISLPPFGHDSLKSGIPNPLKSLYQKTFESLDNIILTVLEKQPTAENAFGIFQHLSEWLTSKRAYERIRAMKLSQLLFSFYNSSEEKKLLPHLGFFVGTLVPRCFDQVTPIHKWASSTLLSILQENRDPSVDYLEGKADEFELKLRASHWTLNTPHFRPTDLAWFIYEHLPSMELMPFLLTTLDGVDEDVTLSGSIIAVLRNMMYITGTRLKDEIPLLLTLLVGKLHIFKDEVVKREIRTTIQDLAQVSPKTVVTSLLMSSLPYSRDVREIWKLIGNNSSLACIALPILLQPNHKAKKRRGSKILEEEFSFTAKAQALWEVMAALQCKEPLEGIENEIFTTYLLSLPLYNTLRLSESQIQTMEDGLKNLLELRGFHDAVVQTEEAGGWKLLTNFQSLHMGVIELVRALTKFPIILNRNVLDSLLPFLMSSKEDSRMVCTALFSELLGDLKLGKLEKPSLKEALKLIIKNSMDVNPTIRFLTVRGLGNSLMGLPKKALKYKKTIFKVLIDTLCWAWEPRIIEETLVVLGKFLPLLETLKQPTAVQLALLVRALFTDGKSSLRLAAIHLFDLLISYFDKKKPVYLIQVGKSLGSLLMLLQDSDPLVVETCKAVLLKCCSFLGQTPLKNLLENIRYEGEINFPQLYDDICKLLIENYPDPGTVPSEAIAASTAEILSYLRDQNTKMSRSESTKELFKL